MRTLGVSVAALVALIATACGSDDGDARTDRTEAPTSASHPKDGPDPADVESAFRDALRSTIDAEQIGFTYRSLFGTTAIMTTSGVQDLSRGWSATSRFDEPGSDDVPFVMTARSTNGLVWMSMKGWPAHLSGCWLAMSATQVPVGILAMIPDEIGYISLLTDLVAQDWEAGSTDYLDATLGMAGAQQLLTGQLTQEIQVTTAQAEDIGVDALVRLRDGRISRLEVQGQSLADEIDRVGGTLSERARVSLNAFHYTVSYEKADAPPEGAPPSALVVSAEEMDAGCH